MPTRSPSSLTVIEPLTLVEAPPEEVPWSRLRLISARVALAVEREVTASVDAACPGSTVLGAAGPVPVRPSHESAWARRDRFSASIPWTISRSESESIPLDFCLRLISARSSSVDMSSTEAPFARELPLLPLSLDVKMRCPDSCRPRSTSQS